MHDNLFPESIFFASRGAHPVHDLLPALIAAYLRLCLARWCLKPLLRLPLCFFGAHHFIRDL